MHRRLNFRVAVQRRISDLRAIRRVDTQRWRNRWISDLDDLFAVAASIASGRVSQLQVGDSFQQVTLKDRKMWAQIASSIGSTMGNLSRGYDERQVDKDLDELEAMIAKYDKLLSQRVEKDAAKSSDAADYQI